MKDAGGEGEVPAVHVWLVLWKAAHAVEQCALASIRRQGLGLSDFAVLEALLHGGPQPVNTIGRKVMLTSGSITTAVDRLEAKGLVRRTVHETDKRARVVELTAVGNRTIAEAFRSHALDMEDAMKHVSVKERGELVRSLKKLGYTVQQSDAAHEAQ